MFDLVLMSRHADVLLLVVAATAAYLTTWTLRAAWADYDAARSAPALTALDRERLLALGWAQVQTEILYLLQQLIFVVTALLIWALGPMQTHLSIYGIIWRTGMTGVSLLMLLTSFHGRATRRAFLRRFRVTTRKAAS